MAWANPEWLWLLVLIPALVAVYAGYWVWKSRAARQLANPALIARRSGRKQVLRFALTTAAIALMILALARPQWGERARKVKREGIDVVIALDISRSMLAADVNPSRLRAAKDELARVLGQLRGDRVGLVVFTGISFAQSPLTSDYGAIRFYLRRLDPSDMPVGGTASGRAILDGVELLTGERLGRGSKEAKEAEKVEKALPMKRAKTQVIVLITDGEDHQGDPEAAAEEAAKRGIKIFTIGLGSARGEPIPIFNVNGQRTEFLKDRQGNTVYTKLNDAPLKKIAAMTGGEYVHYSDRGSMANAITAALNNLEKAELESLLRVEGEDRFPWFLFPALLLLMIALLLGERRGLHLGFWHRHPVEPERRGDETKLKGPGLSALVPWLIVPVALLATGAQGCDAWYENAVLTKQAQVEQGNTYLAAEQPKEALESYKSAEKLVPASPELHYDLGLGFLANEEYEQATASLSRAVESPDEDLRFRALFNLGIAYDRQEKLDEALESLKGALRLRPDDLEAKKAFEVVLNKLYPPCSKLEDDLEDNDTRESASPMDEPEKKDVVLCGGDEDWFAVPVYAGSIIFAEATFERLREKEPGDPPPIPKPDSLRLVLFGPDGESVLSLSDKEPEESPTAKNPEKATRSIGPMRLTPEMLEIAPGAQDLGQAFLRVVGDTGIELKYTVKLKVIPPCFALEDDYEDNDTFSTARSLKPDPDQQVRICKGEEDWYTIDVVPGDDLFIDVTAGFDDETQSEPMLDVALFDETGEVPVSEVETLRTPGGALYGVQLRNITEPRRLALRVQGESGEQQGPYTISKYQYRPCGEEGGDDRFEDNDAPRAPKDLPRGQGPTRHLRLCPGDADFHKLAVQKDDQIVLGIKHDELESDAELDAAPVIFNLWNEGADTIVAEGARIEAAPPEQVPVQMAVSSEKHEEEEPINYVLEVRSPSTEARYYDLIPLDGDAAQQPEQEPQDGEQSEDGEEGEDGEEQEGEQPQPQDGDEEQEEEEQEPQPSEEEPDEERLQEIEEILENLEESDDNFQLRKALKNVPDRYIENDW